MNRFIASKPYPIPDQSEQSLYPFSDRESEKTIPFGVAHTYMAYMREYPHTTPLGGSFSFPEFLYGSKTSKHFPLDDHFPTSHYIFSWLCFDFVRRKLVLVALGT